MIRIPTVTMPTKIISNLLLTTFFSSIIEGNDRAVTAIMKAKTVPIPTPLVTRASAIGKVPKISAYMGIPTKVAITTENAFFSPNMAVIIDSGIQLWIAAPMPTPTKTYNQTL